MHDDNKTDYEERRQMIPDIVCIVIIRHVNSHVPHILRSSC